MKPCFISQADLAPWLARMNSDYGPVYVPRKDEAGLSFCRFHADADEPPVLDGVRAREPIKSFFFPLRGLVGTYLCPDRREAGPREQKRVIVGARSCDLRALEALDLLFRQGDFDDPFYGALRESTLVISSDCSDPLETCFCRLVDLDPYAKKGFDINLSAVEGGYVAESATAGGQMLLDMMPGAPAAASGAQVAERDGKREETAREVDRLNEDYKVSTSYRDVVKAHCDSDVWDEEAAACVECAACTQVCPCCYCFLLYDQRREGGFERVRNWDSCQYGGFAAVAGGANPRARRAERLQHRYAHKFDLFVESHGMTKCSGCGRCVELCMGKIDMRNVLKRAAAGAAAGSSKRAG